METSMTRSGYLISVSSENSDSSEAVPDAVTSLISKGFYATLFSEKWNSSIPSTLGDYLTMKAGDNVYFMCKRIIYGIGEIVQMFPGDAIASFELQDGATTTKYHPDSCLTTTAKAQGNETKTKVMRWGIIFKASPYFFKTGVDMDDMLASNPSAFRSLRTFWKKSFIQFDEVENSAFRSAIIRNNQSVLLRAEASDAFIPCGEPDGKSILPRCSPQQIQLSALLSSKRTSKGEVRDEMLVECALIEALERGTDSAETVFGHWDYISHQVAASPFKPIDYMDRIDVFGYRWIPGYEHQIISKYLVVEIKKGVSDNRNSSSVRDYEQLMKYVDWVCREYAHGDYSMIEAYLLAYDFKPDLATCSANSNQISLATSRSYVAGHKSKTHYWNDITFVKYEVDPSGLISFERVASQNRANWTNGSSESPQFALEVQ